MALLCAGQSPMTNGCAAGDGSSTDGKSLIQPDGGEGCSGMATGYPATVPGEEAAPPRRGAAKIRGDDQEPGTAGLVGRSGNTRKSPLSIIGQTGIPGARVSKAIGITPGDPLCVRLRTGCTVRRIDRAAEVSRRHSSWRKRAGPPEIRRRIPGGLTPTKARTVPRPNGRVNGRGK